MCKITNLLKNVAQREQAKQQAQENEKKRGIFAKPKAKKNPDGTKVLLLSNYGEILLPGCTAVGVSEISAQQYADRSKYSIGDEIADEIAGIFSELQSEKIAYSDSPNGLHYHEVMNHGNAMFHRGRYPKNQALL